MADAREGAAKNSYSANAISPYAPILCASASLREFLPLRDAANRLELRLSARRMKADGMAVETIAKYIGLPTEEIAAL